MPNNISIMLPAGGVHILANTQWRSSTAIVSINTQSGAVTQLTPADGAAWTLLDHNQGASWMCPFQSCNAMTKSTCCELYIGSDAYCQHHSRLQVYQVFDSACCTRLPSSEPARTHG